MTKTNAGFSWGQVVCSTGIHSSTRVSLREKFNLFAEPIAVSLLNASNFPAVNKSCSLHSMTLHHVENQEQLTSRVESATPYQPIICFVDESSMEISEVLAFCKKYMCEFLSIQFILINHRTTTESNQPYHYPNLPLKVAEAPLNDTNTTRLLEEFLVKASRLTDHLVRIRKLGSLNDREQILVQLISMGIPNKRSANLLGLAEKTVEKCRTGIYRKLGIRSTGELASLITMANHYRWPEGVKIP